MSKIYLITCEIWLLEHIVMQTILLTSFTISEMQKIDEKAITEVFLKVLDNYIKWCRYLGIRIVWNR